MQFAQYICPYYTTLPYWHYFVFLSYDTYVYVQCYKPFLFCFIFLAHCNQQNYIPNKNNFKSTLAMPMYIYTCELCICTPIVTNINQALLSSLYSLTSKSNLHGGDMYPVGTYVFEKQIYSSLDITLSVPPSKTI